MSFSSEDRDDMITYVLPHLDETNSNYERQHITFRFLSSDEYSTVALVTKNYSSESNLIVHEWGSMFIQ